MNNIRIYSLFVITLSVLVILTPWLLFPVCGVGRYAMPGGMMKMHGCDTTLYAVTVIGVIGVVVGIVMQIIPYKRNAHLASIAVAVLGGLVILLPTVITGVCKVATMPCVYGTKPALIVAGSIMVIFGALGFILYRK
jgi:hypothetical protein